MNRCAAQRLCRLCNLGRGDTARRRLTAAGPGRVLQTARVLLARPGRVPQTTRTLMVRPGGVLQTARTLLAGPGRVLQTARTLLAGPGRVLQTARTLMVRPGGVPQTARTLLAGPGGVLQTARTLLAGPGGVPQTTRALLAGPAGRAGAAPDRWRSRCGLLLAVSWFTTLTIQSECDNVDFETLLKNKLIDDVDQQTGWDRLVAMYTLDEMGGLTPELELVTSIGTAGVLIGGALGAVLSSRLAIMNFVERNQATMFETPLMAKRALQDRVMVGMARGFFMIGWRTGLFTAAFGLVSTSLMVYTNEISALHYAAAGCTAGALYKVNMGLRGMVAGAVAGSLLGLVGGGAFSLVCYLSGTTLPKLRYQQYLWKHQQDLRMQARAERKREYMRVAAEKKLNKSQTEDVRAQAAGHVVMAGGQVGAPSVAGDASQPAAPEPQGCGDHTAAPEPRDCGGHTAAPEPRDCGDHTAAPEPRDCGVHAAAPEPHGGVSQTTNAAVERSVVMTASSQGRSGVAAPVT